MWFSNGQSVTKQNIKYQIIELEPDRKKSCEKTYTKENKEI
jgi:hypothetical protein